MHIISRVKSENEKGYYIVDAINEAINVGVKISFYYSELNGKKKEVLRNDVKLYTVSPFDLIWDGDYYYLTGYCDEREFVRTYSGWLVTTLGGDGQRIRNAQGVDVHVPAIPCDGVKDPTGAGDSHRAGLLKGLVCGLEMPEAAKLGAVSACYAIEQLGTQEHHFSKDEFRKRYEASFGPLPITL